MQGVDTDRPPSCSTPITMTTLRLQQHAAPPECVPLPPSSTPSPLALHLSLCSLEHLHLFSLVLFTSVKTQALFFEGIRKECYDCLKSAFSMQYCNIACILLQEPTSTSPVEMIMLHFIQNKKTSNVFPYIWNFLSNTHCFQKLYVYCINSQLAILLSS